MTRDWMAGKDALQWLRGRSQRQLHALAALVIVAMGILVVVLFAMLRRAPERIEADAPAPLVEVQRLQVRDIPMVVRGYGTVSPSTQMEIIPEVAGKVVFIHSELKVGGIIPAGETIAQIDPCDYDLAVRQAQAAVAQAQAQLDLERAQAQAARGESRQLNGEKGPDSPLMLRDLQVRQAETALESAKVRLAMADRQRQRTAISLPFDVLVIRERVGLGQFVPVGQSFASVYGLDAFEIEVPLKDEDLAWLDVLDVSVRPGGGGADKKPASAEVRAGFAGRRYTWLGHVTRTTGQVDPATRMVPTVVEIPQPRESPDGRPPLLPGTFVEVRIMGRTLEDAIAVPRGAIEGENRVWLVVEGRLRVRQLEIVRTDDDFAYVTSGLPDGALVVVHAPETAVEGMEVRVQPGNVDSGPVKK